MKNDKLLTISIAAYNAEEILQNAVNSCLAISKKNKELLEIIIVNDGSKDNTLSVAKKFEKTYPDIVKVIDKINGGYGSTINSSLEIAEGKYFKLLDADDLYNTEELDRFIDYLQNEDSDLVITDFSECTPTKTNIVKGVPGRKSGIIKIEEINCNLVMHATCYKTEVLRKSQLRLKEHCLYTDTEFVLYPMRVVKNASYFECNLYKYSLGIDGQSVSKSGRIKHYKDAIDLELRLLEFYRNNKDAEFYSSMIKKLFTSYVFALQAIVMGDPSHKKEAIEFDNLIKREFKEIYYSESQRSLKIFRLNRKIMYPLYRWFLLKR